MKFLTFFPLSYVHPNVLDNHNFILEETSAPSPSTQDVDPELPETVLGEV
jgi:hypothetical protein